MVKTYSVKAHGSTKLSTNFTVREFACKDGSDKVLIDTDLVAILQKIREHFGKPITINSAYRNKAYNAKVGGATNSQHTYGTAADIVVQGVKPEEVAKYAEYLMPKSGGIGLYASFTHVDVRASRSRWKNNGKDVTVSGFAGYKPKETTLAEDCKLLASRGIINSPEYWANGGGYSDTNTVQLIKKFAAYVRGD